MAPRRAARTGREPLARLLRVAVSVVRVEPVRLEWEFPEGHEELRRRQNRLRIVAPVIQRDPGASGVDVGVEGAPFEVTATTS
jgi:hypothetical protein